MGNTQGDTAKRGALVGRGDAAGPWRGDRDELPRSQQERGAGTRVGRLPGRGGTRGGARCARGAARAAIGRAGLMSRRVLL